jgi:hypothetical protein
MKDLGPLHYFLGISVIKQYQWTQSPYQQWFNPVYHIQQQQWAYPWQQWVIPPSQYVTTGAPHQQSGILGPKPQQAHMTFVQPHMYSQQSSSYAPTNIQAAMHNFSTSLPDQWYMDSGATSDMTGNRGN